MESFQLKKKILEKCKELNIPIVGFAQVSRWENPPEELPNKFNEWIPREFWPQSIYPEAKTVIVIGLPVSLPIVETAPSIYYHELYETVNNALDSKAYEISNFLILEGYPSIYLPRDAYGDIDVLLERPYAFFSHKHAAYLAGLGSFGQNNVLLTPEYGPRVRFTSIFTTAEIEGDPVMNQNLCTKCLACVRECPINVIKEEGDFTPPVDKISCAQRSKKLRKEYRSPCGICIKVCPVGEDRKIFKREDTSIYNENKTPERYKKAWKHVRSYGSKK
ncbi:4Fe-4S binding protein [Methanobacterium sp. ACI-7]|uniref:4Fe-4S binding protein n=1 Tax=unclassified Methanobacterium TaxID=2627676 RepID=UPI0039C01F18